MWYQPLPKRLAHQLAGYCLTPVIAQRRTETIHHRPKNAKEKPRNAMDQQQVPALWGSIPRFAEYKKPNVGIAMP